MEHVNTVVIGLGTAGLSACRTLAENNIDYIGLDSKKEIGKPIRSTGGVANTFVNKYHMPNNDDVVVKRIKSMRLSHSSGQSVRIGYDHDVGVIYDFTKYENSIVKDKSRLIMNSPVLGIKDKVIHTPQADYTADNIIIATGPVSNLMPNTTEYTLKPEDTIAGYEETRVVKDVPDDDVILYFDHALAPGGYLWSFADEGNKRRIGLGAVKSFGINLRDSLNKFTALHPELDGEVDHTIAHLIALSKPPRKVIFGNRIYVGEAARTTFAETGGGIQGAWLSGQSAAYAIAHKNKYYYQNEWNMSIRPLLLKHYKVKQFLYSLSDKELEKIIRLLNEYIPKTEDAYKEIPKAAAFIALKMPALLPRVIKLLI